VTDSNKPMNEDDTDVAFGDHAVEARNPLVPLVIAGGVLLTLIVGGWMYVRADAQTNKVTLSATPKGVTVVEAKEAHYRPSRKYIGTIEPWLEAKLGPQFTSAYVDTVLVRPGAVVKHGQVIATLDCRNASAESQAIQMQARALEAQQEALAHQATRIGGLVPGGFVSTNEVENKTAESVAKQAELLAANAKLLRASLEVNDCILRAPFNGEVSTRLSDPGAFARPGSSIVTIVDRSTVRISTDAPENDFQVVAPATEVKIRILATGKEMIGKIARRSPAADPATRTIDFEIDLSDPEREIPVGTTAELAIEVGEPTPAIEIPLIAASVRGSVATIFTVDGAAAHKATVRVLGEIKGNLYVETALKPGTHVITEGRSLIKDGDSVTERFAREEARAPSTHQAARQLTPSANGEGR
jgi:membrane fusion protein, multidrug efflux system